MKRKILITTAILVVGIATGCTGVNPHEVAKNNGSPRPSDSLPRPGNTAPATEKVDPHGHPLPASTVPAFQSDAASLKNLGPTLPPEKFTGKQRAAYQAVKAIPRTIAQLPCYCHCDKGFGHKSLIAVSRMIMPRTALSVSMKRFWPTAWKRMRS